MNKNDIQLIAEAYRSILEQAPQQEAPQQEDPLAPTPAEQMRQQTLAPNKQTELAQQAPPAQPLQYFYQIAQKFGLVPSKSKTYSHIISRAMAHRTRNEQQLNDPQFIDAMSNFSKQQILQLDDQSINSLYNAFKRG